MDDQVVASSPETSAAFFAGHRARQRDLWERGWLSAVDRAVYGREEESAPPPAQPD
jgi:hypothetical protein